LALFHSVSLAGRSRSPGDSIDAWLARVATRVYTRIPFELGVIGFEAAGDAEADDLASGPPEARYFGYLLPRADGLAYTEANR
jgi:hypothetical protein